LELGFANGREWCTIGDADRSWWRIVVVGYRGCSTVAVVVTGPSVGNGGEIVVMME
jgi:hypothetical protein